MSLLDGLYVMIRIDFVFGFKVFVDDMFLVRYWIIFILEIG